MSCTKATRKRCKIVVAKIQASCYKQGYLFEVLSWKFILSQPYVGRIKMKTYNSPTNFPSPQGTFIWLNSAILKYEIKCEIWPDINLASSLLTLNIFEILFLCIFCWLWTCKLQMEYFIALTLIYLCISESDLGTLKI